MKRPASADCGTAGVKSLAAGERQVTSRVLKRPASVFCGAAGDAQAAEERQVTPRVRSKAQSAPVESGGAAEGAAEPRRAAPVRRRKRKLAAEPAVEGAAEPAAPSLEQAASSSSMGAVRFSPGEASLDVNAVSSRASEPADMEALYQAAVANASVGDAVLLLKVKGLGHYPSSFDADSRSSMSEQRKEEENLYQCLKRRKKKMDPAVKAFLDAIKALPMTPVTRRAVEPAAQGREQSASSGSKGAVGLPCGRTNLDALYQVPLLSHAC